MALNMALVAFQEGFEPPTDSLEGIFLITIDYFFSNILYRMTPSNSNNRGHLNQLV